MKFRPVVLAATLTVAAIATAPTVAAQQADDMSSSTAISVTNVTGAIAQTNYGSGGQVEGFLIGTNVLLTFGSQVSGGVASLGVAGNNVTYSGSSVTDSTTSFSTVRVTSFKNNTTGASYTSSTTTTTPTATAYGPTAGTLKQLNYDQNGAINGFLFTASGSSTAVFVSTGSGASSTLKPLLTVGGTVSVTGTTMSATAASTCTASTALTVVEASSLIVNGQTIVITNRAGGGMGGGMGSGHGR
ncbi:MAG: hypothetical protein JSU00_16750 [Acidobacteria bacterium]|nr:hypothetical protein [Acidobacteriota bacterium]